MARKLEKSTSAGEDVPIAVTDDIGHGTDSKAVMIGRRYEF